MVHGVSAETADDVRPPPSRSINAVPGHTTPTYKPEPLKRDKSLAPPEKYNHLINAFAPGTYGVALDENENIDVCRVRGVANVHGAMRYFDIMGVVLVRLPPDFYVALGVDPVAAQSVPGSSATPWGCHLAVKKGLIPFFVYFDIHGGSTLCGPNSKYWDGTRIRATLLAEANMERIIAGRTPIDIRASLFELHEEDPAAAGRRVAPDSAEWTAPCVRGGQTTKEKWRRLREEAAKGTISEEDAEELTYLLACCHLGGQMTREMWKRLQADEKAGKISEKDAAFLAYLRANSSRGGATTTALWERLKADEKAGKISEEDAAYLAYLRANISRGGASTTALWERLQAEEATGKLSEEDAAYLAYLRANSSRAGKLGGATTTALWDRLQADEKAGKISEEDAANLAKRRADISRGGATTTALWERLQAEETTGKLSEEDAAYLAKQRANSSRGGKLGGKLGGATTKALWDRLKAEEATGTISEEDAANLAKRRADKSRASVKGCGNAKTIGEVIDMILVDASARRNPWVTWKDLFDKVRESTDTSVKNHQSFNAAVARYRKVYGWVSSRTYGMRAAGEIDVMRDILSLTTAELKAELRKRDVPYRAKDGVGTLRDRLRTKLKEEGEENEDTREARGVAAAADAADAVPRELADAPRDAPPPAAARDAPPPAARDARASVAVAAEFDFIDLCDSDDDAPVEPSAPE